LFLRHGGLCVRKSLFQKYLWLTAGLVGGWFILRFGLPVLLPFLLGAAIALAAEPLVRLLHSRLPRWLSAGIGVTVVFILLLTLIALVIALCFREAGQLTHRLPSLIETAQDSLGNLEQKLLHTAEKMPEAIRPAVENGVTEFFSDGSAVVDRASQAFLGLATGLLGRIVSGAFGLITGVLAAFMISGRLPQIKQTLSGWLPTSWNERYLPALKSLKTTLIGWLKAQVKLSLITAGILLGGFLILRIPHAPVWAAVISLVDALPVLGTGIVVVPWGIFCLLQGQQVRGIGLLALYGVVWLVRSIMEPKLLGKGLGLDPLVTLLSMYAGYKLFALPGLLLAPMLAVIAMRLSKALKG
jgi:sporulation integral membrane protein YtvI